jgi:hypothetical protein
VSKVLVPIACVWATCFLVLYITIARQPQNQGPTWWFVGMIGLGDVAAALSPRWPRGRNALLLVATAAFGLGVLAGLVSVGLLLLPAAVLTLIALLLGIAAPKPST